MRDGSYFGFNNTDLNGFAGFNEVFPILSWLVVDIDNARYKLTGVHVIGVVTVRLNSALLLAPEASNTRTITA